VISARRTCGIPTTGDLHFTMDSIKTQVQQGEYRVDPPAVADAIISRFLMGTARPRGGFASQNECSNPDNGSSASTNTAAGEPSVT
jgi:hypothetical protein